jgi:hypothetical protein
MLVMFYSAFTFSRQMSPQRIRIENEDVAGFALAARTAPPPEDCNLVVSLGRSRA